MGTDLYSLFPLLLGACALFLVPPALGKRIMGPSTSFASSTATGWITCILISSILGYWGILSREILLSLTCVGMIALYQDISLLVCQIFSLVKQEWQQSTRLQRAILTAVLLLLLLRFFRCLLPSINWDSLSNHFTLLRERLSIGNFDPLYFVPTDRRTPLGGVLFKLWSFSMDLNGRLLLIFNFCLYINCLTLLRSLFKRATHSLWPLYGVVVYVSVTDISVYITSGGDEALMSFLILLVVDTILSPSLSRKALLVGWTALGLTYAVKLTALFWVPLVPLLGYRSWRSSKLISLWGVLLLLLPGVMCHYKTYSDYDIVYPFSRWTNLLYQGEEGASKTISVQQVRSDRTTLGINADRDDRPIMSKAGSLFFKNSSTFSRLFLGPIVWLALFALIGAFLSKGHHPAFSHQEAPIITSCLLVSLACLLLSFLSWPFSPQAMYRYHLPTWGPLLVAVTIPTVRFFKSLSLESSLLSILFLFSIFSFSLEAKVLYSHMHKDFLHDPDRYWQQSAVDGRLLAKVNELRKNDEAVFYIGSSSFLLKGAPNWYAQLGNEVGWRKKKDIEVFIKKQKICYWIISERCKRINQSYDGLTQHLIKQNVLTLLHTMDQGRIYQVQVPPQ